MYHEFFTSQGVLFLPILAMLLFVATFACVVVWALARGAQYQGLASLPLESEPERARPEADHD